MVTCEEAKQLRSGINVQGKIVDKGEVRTVTTKFGETKVCDAYLEDESGRIKLTLWADDTEKVNNGNMVSLEGGYTTIFRNEVQLNKSRKDGKLEIIPDKAEQSVDESPPPEQSVDESPPPDESAKVKELEQQVKELEQQNQGLYIGMMDILDSYSPDKNTKRPTDKKEAENQKSHLVGVDLLAMDLRDAKLSDAKLSCADLRGTDLRGADLRGADLRGAVLCGAKLAHADFDGADLSLANLTDVMDLIDVDLINAKRWGTIGLDLKKTGKVEKGHSGIGKSH